MHRCCGTRTKLMNGKGNSPRHTTVCRHACDRAAAIVHASRDALGVRSRIKIPRRVVETAIGVESGSWSDRDSDTAEPGAVNSAPAVVLEAMRRSMQVSREGHLSGSVTGRRRCCGRSPLCHWPESFVGTHRAATTFTMGGSGVLHFSECYATKRSWVPESFRGSCSFGGQRAGSLPLIAKVNLPLFVAELCCSRVSDQTPTTPSDGSVLSSASESSTVTLVPTGTRRCRSTISWLKRRMHPLETDWPMVSGSCVPWMR